MAHAKPGHHAPQAAKPHHEQPRPGKNEPSGKEGHEEKIHYDGPRREPGGYDDIQDEGFANVDIQNHAEEDADSRGAGTKTSGKK